MTAPYLYYTDRSHQTVSDTITSLSCLLLPTSQTCSLNRPTLPSSTHCRCGRTAAPSSLVLVPSLMLSGVTSIDSDRPDKDGDRYGNSTLTMLNSPTSPGIAIAQTRERQAGMSASSLSSPSVSAVKSYCLLRHARSSYQSVLNVYILGVTTASTSTLSRSSPSRRHSVADPSRWQRPVTTTTGAAVAAQ